MLYIHTINLYLLTFVSRISALAFSIFAYLLDHHHPTTARCGVRCSESFLPLLPLSGVDWKSLSIPACLPITTDYFPDKRSLHNDYVISDYTLLPDDVNLDYAKSRAVYRKPLSTEEVCKEIVSQRLAQGFQLIVVEEKNPSNSNGSGSGANGHGSCASNSNQSTSAVRPVKQSCETNKEYLLSIGRIFHKISLSGSVITVTGYRPR